ncbi:Uncharacterised protein [Bordetella pertussis]|nr:Uncharacterised protein [Bordetella pertussis]CPN96603.1 Uncharacterised protein [Bordetella pertussis]CRE11566.1 Uncharacterised protein [Bordetella pertussis]
MAPSPTGQPPAPSSTANTTPPTTATPVEVPTTCKVLSIPDAMPACSSRTEPRIALNASGITSPWPAPLSTSDATKSGRWCGCVAAVTTESATPAANTSTPNSSAPRP